MAAHPAPSMRPSMPTPTPWVSPSYPPPAPTREEPTLKGVVMVLGNLVGSRARVVANGVARDLTMSSRALTIEGLPDRQTTNLLRFWFVVAAGVVGFLLASTLASGVGMASTLASTDAPVHAKAPTRHETTVGTRVLIVTPLVMASARSANVTTTPEPAPVVAAPVVAPALAPAPPPVRAVPVVAKVPPPPPKAPVVTVKAPAAPAPAPPPPSNKSLFADALK